MERDANEMLTRTDDLRIRVRRLQMKKKGDEAKDEETQIVSPVEKSVVEKSEKKRDEREMAEKKESSVVAEPVAEKVVVIPISEKPPSFESENVKKALWLQNLKQIEEKTTVLEEMERDANE